MNKKIILMLMFVALFASNVLALGITPGKTTFDYVPGEQRTVIFTVVNSEQKDVDLVVFVQGEFNESIALSEISISMGADEKDRELQYTFTMPFGLSPGSHEAEIVVLELPKKSGTSEAFIGAVIGVATQLHVFVPFPGKYAEAAFNVIGPDDEGVVTFVIPVLSRGDLDLVRVRGTIDVFSGLNEKIVTLETAEVKIPSQQRKEIVATWDTSGIQPGPYRAVATVIYDEDTLTLENEFNVGKRLLEISNIKVNDFSLGEIAKFELLIENKWSQAITGAYAQMLIFNDEGSTMADFKSATYDIPPLEKILMVAFWDSAGVNKGIYDSSLFLRYGGQSQQQDLQLEVKDNEIRIIGVGYVISEEDGGGFGFDNSLIIILITVIVVLVMINVLWFLVLRKKLSGKSGK